MVYPSGPFDHSDMGLGGEPDGSSRRVPRFPWISLAITLLAVVGVLVAVGLGVAAGIQSNLDDQHALDDAVRVVSHESATVPVSGPSDVVHVWVEIPADAAAWRADGTLVYPTSRPFQASQGGTFLPLDDQLPRVGGVGSGGDLPSDGGDLGDEHTLSNGSTLVKLDDIHPLRAGSVEVEAADLTPGSMLRLALDPSRTSVEHRAVVAGIVGAVSVLVGLAAFVTFLVMLVRRQRAKPRPRRPPPSYGGSGGYTPYLPYSPSPLYPPPPPSYPVPGGPSPS